MNYFYQSKISNPLSNLDYYEIRRNQQIYKNILDRQVQEKKEREKLEKMKYQEEDQRNKYFMEKKMYENQLEERKEREEKKRFYYESLNEQIREKNQQLYSNNNNNIFQLSPVYDRPFYIGPDRNERMHNFGNYLFRNDNSNIFMNTKIIEEQSKMNDLENKLKKQNEEENNLVDKWNLKRNKNNNLVKDIEIQFIKNKQLEEALEDIINYDIQEYMFQDILSKNNYLQKRFEEEINMNKEMEIIDNYEEENKFTDSNYNNYYNNERYNTLKTEYYRKRNQFLEKKLNEKYLKINNLKGLIKKEEYLNYELRQNLDNQKAKNQRLKDEIKYIKLENEDEKRKNHNLNQIIKNWIK